MGEDHDVSLIAQDFEATIITLEQPSTLLGARIAQRFEQSQIKLRHAVNDCYLALQRKRARMPARKRLMIDRGLRSATYLLPGFSQRITNEMRCPG